MDVEKLVGEYKAGALRSMCQYSTGYAIQELTNARPLTCAPRTYGTSNGFEEKIHPTFDSLWYQRKGHHAIEKLHGNIPASAFARQIMLLRYGLEAANPPY